MLDSTLFDDAVDNRGLFSDHYLESRFPKRKDIQALADEADAAFDRVQALMARYADEVDTWNEAQTEDRFVQPVLEVLGWAREVQRWVQRQGQVGRPDYALFTSEDRRAKAVKRAGDDKPKVYDYASAVAEAKYWGRPLDGPAPNPAREKTAEMRRENPSLQVLDYVGLTRVDWGILTNGACWRLYYDRAPSKLTTYFEVDLQEVVRLTEGDEDDQAAARHAFRLFYALFRADAHRPVVDGETFVNIIYKASDTYAEDLEDALKERVFDHVFLELATGLYENHVRRSDTEDPDAVLDDVYRATLRLLYRLLFLFYAESRGLLPLDNPSYYENSLTHAAERARTAHAIGRSLSRRHTGLWDKLQALFETIDQGDPAFDVPAYNGGLFRQDDDQDDNRDDDANAFLDDHDIGQRYVVRALVHLTAVDPEHEPTGPSVDYKSLDVRQLGSIYEGLLEHRLVRTDDEDDPALDLVTDKGERKKTGSYYTPHYVVEYIVEETLGPIVEERKGEFEAAMEAIDAILDGRDPDDPGVRAKLDKHRQRALDALLTVRVCDPAMGSGHFLVYAADYLAEQFAQVLGRYPDNNPVTARLEDIRGSIIDDLERQGVDTASIRTENRLRDTSLLKRLVMKRCIYGVDLNPMAVELAKLSLWLHSFTVGAPLSFLDHHLKPGNSLIGSRVDAVVDAIKTDLFGNIRGEILRGTKFLQDAAFNADATPEDVADSAAAFRAYQDKMRPYKRLLDLWTSQHFGNDMGRTLVRDYAREVIDAHKTGDGAILDAQRETVDTAERLSAEKRVFHWELEFPEVFYELDPPGERDNPGFDAVIGNPPYVRMEEFKDQKTYLKQSYQVHAERTDLYGYFIEQALRLVADERRLGYIVSNKWMRANYGRPIQTLIEETATARRVVDFGDLPVFDATTYPLIVIASKEVDDDAIGLSARIPDLTFDELHQEVERVGVSFTQGQLKEAGWALLGNPGLDIVTRIREQSIPLAEYVGVPPLRGIVTGLNDAFIVDQKTCDQLIADDPKSEEILFPVRTGRDVRRYAVDDAGTFLIYTKHGVDIHRYPAIEQHLRSYKAELEDRATDQEWYELQQPQEAYVEKLRKPKIVHPDIAEDVRFHIDKNGFFTTNTAYFIPRGNEFLLAILNSQTSNFFLKSTSAQYRGGYMRLFGQYVENLPIPKIKSTVSAAEREQHVDALIDAYETALDAGAEPSDNDVLEEVDTHLAATPERTDIVRDLLAHLAREMTRMKEARHNYHLDLTDYVSAPDRSADGVALQELGDRYQPAPGVGTSILADTTRDREKLKVGRLFVRVDHTDGDATVTVKATARYKPDADEGVAKEDLDSYGYYETDPVDVCTLRGCTALEAGLVQHWLAALDDRGDGFSGYRDNATKTNSLRDRILALRLPDPEVEATNLRPFLDNARAAARLDHRLAFTDALIDRIVYRLYDLSDDEIAIVEG